MTPVPSRLPVAAVLFMVSLAASGVAAGQVPEAPQPPVAAAQDARETRQQLDQILRRLPPSVGGALRLDSSLLRNESYLATYPELAAFLQRHPEVASNAEYYLQNVNPVAAFGGRMVSAQSTTPDPRIEAIRMWRSLFSGFTAFLVFLVVTGAVVWLLRSLIAQRRWTRTSRVLAEVHGKLVDRFSTNEELLAYIQTPAARRFLDAAPFATETGVSTPAVSAPLSRMLWSVQAGVVLAVAGLGLLYVSTRVIEEIGEVLFALSILVLAIGAGFVVSVGASYLLSRRLGLLEAPAVANRPGPTEGRG